MEFLMPDIIFMETTKFIGMKYYGKNKNDEIKDLWNQFSCRINEIENKSDSLYYGLCEIVPGSNKYTYISAVKVDSVSNLPTHMHNKTLYSSKYAVFSFDGTLKNLGQVYEYIYGEWLPTSKYEHANLPNIEVFDKIIYFDENEECSIKVYIPIH